MTPPSQKVPWTPPPNARPGRPRAHGRESSPLPASPPRPRERRPTASGRRGPGTLPTPLPSRRGTGSSHSRAARPRALPAARKPHAPSRPRLGGGSGRDCKTPARSPAEALLAGPVVPGTKPTSRPSPAPRQLLAGQAQGRRAEGRTPWPVRSPHLRDVHTSGEGEEWWQTPTRARGSIKGDYERHLHRSTTRNKGEELPAAGPHNGHTGPAHWPRRVPEHGHQTKQVPGPDMDVTSGDTSF